MNIKERKIEPNGYRFFNTKEEAVNRLKLVLAGYETKKRFYRISKMLKGLHSGQYRIKLI